MLYHLVIFISLIIYFLYINYINKLEREKCCCSNNPNRTYIKYYTALLILINIFATLYPNELNQLLKRKNPFINVIALVSISSFIYYIYVLRTYSTSLINQPCKCANEVELFFMKYHSLVLSLFMMYYILDELI